MNGEDTLHKREFTLTVKFTDEERKLFFEQLGWEPEDGNISDAIISEVTSNLNEVGLRPTVVRIQ